MVTRYLSHGKLLLSGEYLVLYGASALAVPVKFCQWMDISEPDGLTEPVIKWNAKNNGKLWFNATYNKYSLEILDTNHFPRAEKLKRILSVARKLNTEFLTLCNPVEVVTDTDFDITWGLGTSSTLLTNLAEWAQTDPFRLFFEVSEGSGYDIACAVSAAPVIYRRNGHLPVIEKVVFYPGFHHSLYFVYLGRKQDSTESVRSFLSKNNAKSLPVEKISEITGKMLHADNLRAFEEAIREHEEVISGLLGISPVKQTMFKDFQGEIKSLGAWGGDFILVTWTSSKEELKKYFYRKGLETVIPFSEMIL